ncbi:MAG: DNA replication/repair protein RecF, partial [Anaerolineaceae bacterium]|nr:DNA replication/repair protein RecF [Anaerolineaceae bacterium]
RQLVNFVAGREPLAVTRLVADFQSGNRSRRLEVRLIQENGTGAGTTPRLCKEILLDGVKRSNHEAMGAFTAVIFLPQMTRIIEGGPEERRRYLNLALAQTIPGYSQILSEYGQALTQRNALLKQLFERGGDPDQLVYWDTLLADRGSQILRARIAAVQELEQLAARIHHRLTNTSEILRLVYQPAYDPVPQPEGQFGLPMDVPVNRSGFSLERIRQGYMQRLAELHREEIARGVTTIGPHRDELRLLSNGIDLGNFGSRGQVRTALLALKLAEVTWIKNHTNEWPVLLLDEILAELDGQRRVDMQGFLTEYEQTILTTTDLGLFDPAFVEQGTVWQVEQGFVRVPDAAN